MFSEHSRLFLTLIFCCVVGTVGVPTWEGLNGRDSIGSLVPGAAYIEALGAVRDNELQTKHLSVQFPGQPGNLTVAPNTRAPPLFYIKNNQLWQFNNETAIYYVNVLNVTKTAGFPLQLVLGKKQVGVTSGSWRWRGTMLYYDQGVKGNTGLYYSCPIDEGSTGVFMFLQASQTPHGCETLTLHSFSRNYINRPN